MSKDNMGGCMEYVQVPVTKINESKYNPGIRTDRTKASYKKLRDSIEEHGLIVPIVLNRHLKVVDGHRRLNCFRDLSLDSIPAMVNKSVHKNNYDKIFMVANENSMKITAAQETERYLAGASVISPSVLKAIKALEEIGGRNCIKRIVADEKSPNTYLIGITMFTSYTKKRTRKAKRQCLYWMFNVGSAYMLKTAINFFIPADVLVDCVENRKRVVAQWTGNQGGDTNK